MTGEPWAKRDGETSKSYKAFCLYRDLGDERKLETVTSMHYFKGLSKADVGSKFKTKHNQVEKWSSANEWVKRVEAYDEYLIEKAREVDEEGRIKAIKRQKEIADAILSKIHTHVTSEEFDPSKMNDRNLITLLEKSVNIERVLFGESTENVNNKIEMVEEADLDRKLIDRILNRVNAGKP